MKHLTHVQKRVIVPDIYIPPQVVSKGLTHRHNWGDQSTPLIKQRCLICNQSRPQLN